MIFVSSFLEAHKTGLSFVDVKEDENKNVKVVYKKPLNDTQAQRIIVSFPPACEQTTLNVKSIENGFVIEKYELLCREEGLLNSRIWIEGLLSKDRGVLLRYEKGEFVEKALLRATTPFMEINRSGGDFELFKDYVNLGVIHILTGYDHLFFVLALILLALNFKALLYAITAFTLSHSITLAFGILGMVSVDVSYVEAMIALSILFLARELVTDDKSSFTRRKLAVVAFVFGLLHGFGFSNVLTNIGLPQDEIPLSLFAFNLGIGMGQVLFILGVKILFFVFKRHMLEYENRVKTYVAYFIGSLSSLWLIERVASF